MYVINLEFILFGLFLLLFYCVVLHKEVKRCFKYGNTSTKALTVLLILHLIILILLCIYGSFFYNIETGKTTIPTIKYKK